MGNSMNKVLPNLWVGNYQDAKDETRLAEENITHILSVHDTAKEILQNKKYLCIVASDSASQDLRPYFSEAISFIHAARLQDCGVLVHCLAGVSRSVTLAAAYIMTITSLSWREALNVIRGARRCANPNYGFQKQLQAFQTEDLENEKARLRVEFPYNPLSQSDDADCRSLIDAFQKYVLYGDNGCDDDDLDGLYPLPHNAYKAANLSVNPPDGMKTNSAHSAVSTSPDKQTQNDPSTSHVLNQEADIINANRNANKVETFEVS